MHSIEVSRDEHAFALLLQAILPRYYRPTDDLALLRIDLFALHCLTCFALRHFAALICLVGPYSLDRSLDTRLVAFLTAELDRPLNVLTAALSGLISFWTS